MPTPPSPSSRHTPATGNRALLFVLGFAAVLLLMALIVVGLLAGGLLWWAAPSAAQPQQTPITLDTTTPTPTVDPPPAFPSSRQPTADVAASTRSPMPEPGEHLQRPFPARRVGEAPATQTPPVPVVAAPPVAAGEVVPWDQAAGHIGRTITTRGTIVRAKAFPGVTLLNFAHDYRDKFYLAVYDSATHDLPAPAEAFYVGKTVEATGKVDVHGPGKPPQIQVRRADQIRVVQP